MTRTPGDDEERSDLIEPQGVNAGPPPDEETGEAAPDDRPGDGPAGRGGTPGPCRAPDPADLLAAAPDEMAGLPEQRPGYPGQQRSVDTS